MTDATHMQLVFRLGGMGFVLPIGDLVEVREAVSAVPRAEPPGQAGNTPAVIDLHKRFDLPDPGPGSRAVLVLCGQSGSWMLPVDHVEGIFPAGDFTPLHLPELLSRTVPVPWRELVLWREEPLQTCDALLLEQFGRDA